MNNYGKAFRVGSLLVQRVPVSTPKFRAQHQQRWCGYICFATVPRKEVRTIGKLIEVASRQQLQHEQDSYRAEIGVGSEVSLAYYEVIDVPHFSSHGGEDYEEKRS